VLTALFSDLLLRYAEPHRRYHDLRHLAAVLGALDLLSPYSNDMEAVRLAAWFHDAVYDPRAGDNEECSAALAEKVLPPAGVPAQTVAAVARLVRLTATHEPASGDRDGAVLCDADLAVLASSPENYQRYVDAVRAEHSHLPDSVFAAGRAIVIRSLLGLPALFRTPHGKQHWEPAARANLERELRLLGEVDAGGAAPPPPTG